MDFLQHNRQAWDNQVTTGCKWTVPFDSERIDLARKGVLDLVLTPTKKVPADWFPPLQGLDVLCLASGGGQQGPLLAAAGANVTVFDNSLMQLKQDQIVAERESLEIKTVQGDMSTLDPFADESFDLVFHPCSLSFVPDVQPVFNEVARVMRSEAVYLLGFCNPINYVFDYDELQKGELVVRHSVPYSDLTSLKPEELQGLVDGQEPLCFGHSLESLIGGQLKAGLRLTGFYEDIWGEGAEKILDQFMATMIATRAIKK